MRRTREGRWSWGMAIIAAMVIGLAGCETLSSSASRGGQVATDTVRDHPGTVVGAGAGAVGGAVVGGLAAGSKGAVIGGLVGALAGGVIGNYVERRDDARSPQPVVGAASPAPDGATVRMDRAAATPALVPPGGTVDLGATYTLLGASDRPLAVRETREVRHEGQLVANPTTDVMRTNGTYTTSLPITLPTTATAGRYEVTTTVALGDHRASQTSTFQVR